MMKKKLMAILLGASLMLSGGIFLEPSQVTAQAETADNEMYSADALSNNGTGLQQIERSHARWYSYTFEKTGYAYFSVFLVNSKDKYTLTLYDESGAKIKSYDGKRGQDIQTCKLGYEAGTTIYLKLYCNSTEKYKVPGDYSLDPFFSEDSSFESENNGSMDTADEFGIFGMHGVCVNSNDTDFYKYEPQYGAPVRFTLINTNSVSNATWTIKVFDEDGKQLQSLSNRMKDFSVTTKQFNYPKGKTLYLSIKTSSFNNACGAEYSIEANEDIDSEADWETEYNGDIDSADTIIKGTTIKGTILDSSDDDYFVFKASKKNAKFHFKPLNSDGKGRYKINVYDKNGNKLSLKAKNDSAKTYSYTSSAQTYTIPKSKKGQKYYISISVSTSSVYDKGYSITLK